MEKIVKVRKDYLCQYCNQVINKGENATFYSVKTAKYNKDEIQIGIEYYRGYLHFPPECCPDFIKEAERN